MSKASMQPPGNPFPPFTFRAEAASVSIPLTRGYGVMAGTAEDQVKVPTGAGVRCKGVVSETQNVANAPVGIVYFGPCIGIAGQAAITPDMELMLDADGKFVTAEGDAANERAGRAMSSAAAEDDEFIVFVNPVKLWT